MGILAVIPARGGSKGIPRKNLREVAGRPLLVHAVNLALRVPEIDWVVVSTEDEEIARVGRAAGADVIMRPAELADDRTPTLPVLIHAMDEMAERGHQVDILTLFEPTSPFRDVATAQACLAKFADPSVNSVVTVTQVERNPYNIFVVDGDHAERLLQGGPGKYHQRQEFQDLKRINGCIYASRAQVLRAGLVYGLPLRVVEMSELRSINIDTPLDLELARLVAERHPDLIPQ